MKSATIWKMENAGKYGAGAGQGQGRGKRATHLIKPTHTTKATDRKRRKPLSASQLAALPYRQ